MRRRGGGREPGHRAPPAPCRGQANRVLGHHTALLAMIKGLPLTYNKDLQEDKQALGAASTPGIVSCTLGSACRIVLEGVEPRESRSNGAGRGWTPFFKREKPKANIPVKNHTLGEMPL